MGPESGCVDVTWGYKSRLDRDAKLSLEDVVSEH